MIAVGEGSRCGAGRTRIGTGSARQASAPADASSIYVRENFVGSVGSPRTYLESAARNRLFFPERNRKIEAEGPWEGPKEGDAYKKNIWATSAKVNVCDVTSIELVQNNPRNLCIGAHVSYSKRFSSHFGLGVARLQADRKCKIDERSAIFNPNFF